MGWRAMALSLASIDSIITSEIEEDQFDYSNQFSLLLKIFLCVSSFQLKSFNHKQYQIQLQVL